MFQIACNWSASLEALLIEEAGIIDYIKTGVYGSFEEQFATIRSYRPILLHGLGCFDHSGMKDIGAVDFERANRLIAQCGSPHYGLHLAIKNADMPSPMSDEEIHGLMSRQIKVFQHTLAVPLLLENTPDSPEDRTVFDHYPYAEAEKIRRLVVENDVGLLLDLTHASITAAFRGWDIHAFLLALPLERIREIHVNGHGTDTQGFPIDTHQAMEAEDYRLLYWVLEHSHPEFVTLEYSGVASEEPAAIAENLRRQIHTLNLIRQTGSYPY